MRSPPPPPPRRRAVRSAAATSRLLFCAFAARCRRAAAPMLRDAAIAATPLPPMPQDVYAAAPAFRHRDAPQPQHRRCRLMPPCFASIMPPQRRAMSSAAARRALASYCLFDCRRVFERFTPRCLRHAFCRSAESPKRRDAPAYAATRRHAFAARQPRRRREMLPMARRRRHAAVTPPQPCTRTASAAAAPALRAGRQDASVSSFRRV